MKLELARVGDHFRLVKGASYSSKNLVSESDTGLLTINAFHVGGGYKPQSEKPFQGKIKEEHSLREGDVLLAMTEQDEGLLASPLIVRKAQSNFENLLFSLDVAKPVATSGEIEPEFLFNVLRIPAFRKRAAYGDTGSTVQRLPYDALGDFRMPKPPLKVQRAINRIAALIDEKIWLNGRMSDTLEKLSASMFRSWFIDFDPVRAKMAGEVPAGMDAETAALFPDSMEESELGNIPRAWRVTRLGDLARTLLGGTPSRKQESFWGGNVPWINSGKMNDFRVTSPSEYITELGLEKSATKLLPKGTCAIAITGATLGQFTRLEIDSCANQSVVGVLESEAISNEFIYLLFAHQIDRLVSAQTGGAQQHINKNDVNDFRLVCPPEDVMAEFTRIVRPIFDAIGLRVFESESLRALRDGLLPRLISGELEIPDEMLPA